MLALALVLVIAPDHSGTGTDSRLGTERDSGCCIDDSPRYLDDSTTTELTNSGSQCAGAFQSPSSHSVRLSLMSFFPSPKRKREDQDT